MMLLKNLHIQIHVLYLHVASMLIQVAQQLQRDGASLIGEFRGRSI